MLNCNRILTIILLTLFISCGNQDTVKNSKKKQISETEEIKSEKIKLTNTADSLTEKINKLREKKNLLVKNNRIAEAEIFSILKNSEFDHVIIGTENLRKISDLFKNYGFTIKNGKQHENGISNNFIEFGNNSEIEFIEVNKPLNQIATKYSSFIKQKKYGIQIALRVSKIENLKVSFEKLKLPFINLDENPDYLTLSSDIINSELPIFFIQYKKQFNNSLVTHKNGSQRIIAVWISTKDIKKSAHELACFGFNAVGNYKIPEFNKKIVQFKNSYFSIILIKSEKYEISGITISVKNTKKVKNFLEEVKGIDFIAQSVPDRKSIYLNPEESKSIWIEFTELNK